MHLSLDLLIDGYHPRSGDRLCCLEPHTSSEVAWDPYRAEQVIKHTSCNVTAIFCLRESIPTPRLPPPISSLTFATHGA